MAFLKELAVAQLIKGFNAFQNPEIYQRYQIKNKNYKAPHYVIFSIPLFLVSCYIRMYHLIWSGENAIK
jgi:hypothetical protein